MQASALTSTTADAPIYAYPVAPLRRSTPAADDHLVYAAAAHLEAVEPLCFSGAREWRTKSSDLGVAQAWSVVHLDETLRERNMLAIDRVVRLMHERPELGVVVHPLPAEPREQASRVEAVLARWAREHRHLLSGVVDNLVANRTIGRGCGWRCNAHPWLEERAQARHEEA